MGSDEPDTPDKTAQRASRALLIKRQALDERMTLKRKLAAQYGNNRAARRRAEHEFKRKKKKEKAKR